MILFLTAVICFFAFSLLCVLFWKQTKPKVSSAVVATLTGILVLGLLFLIGTGRLHWLVGIATAIFPFLRRGFGLLRFFPMLSLMNRFFGGSLGGFSPFAQNTASAPDTSETETSELKMVLNHTTQELSGTVYKGKYAHRTLGSLSEEEIVELWNMLEEEQSSRLLATYIQRYHPNIEVNVDEDTNDHNTEPQVMNVERACAVLGVEETATKEEITEAYKRLIQHVHPDRGGSSYLTSELNEAKKVLLDRFS